MIDTPPLSALTGGTSYVPARLDGGGRAEKVNCIALRIALTSANEQDVFADKSLQGWINQSHTQ